MAVTRAKRPASANRSDAPGMAPGGLLRPGLSSDSPGVATLGPGWLCRGVMTYIVVVARLDDGLVVGGGPVPQRADRLAQGVAEFGQAVFDARRDFGID